MSNDELIGALSVILAKVREIEAELELLIPSPRDGQSIDDLEISVRAYNCLKNKGIVTVGQLRLMSISQLLRIENLGVKTLREIQQALKIYASEHPP